MEIDHSNPYIHSTTVLCDIASSGTHVLHENMKIERPDSECQILLRK